MGAGGFPGDRVGGGDPRAADARAGRLSAGEGVVAGPQQLDVAAPVGARQPACPVLPASVTMETWVGHTAGRGPKSL